MSIISDLTATTLCFTSRLLCGVNARWLGCYPEATQRIYFANHTSHFDALILWSALPVDLRNNVRPLAARDYWEVSALRRFLAIDVFNAILVDRSPKGSRGANIMESFNNVIEQMGRTYSLIMFPEGTRSDGAEIKTFKSGLYHIAKARPDLEFIPVYLENMNRIMPKGEMLPVPFLGNVFFGSPLHYDGHESRTEFLERARKAITDMEAA